MAERDLYIWAPVIREGAQGTEMARGILRYARTEPAWQVHVSVAATTRYHARHIRHTPPDGIVGCICSHELLTLVRALRRPVVDLSWIFLEQPFPRVGVDDDGVVRRAADCLAGLGLRRFALVGQPALAYSRVRMAAFQREVGARGLICQSLAEYAPDLEPGPWMAVRARAGMAAWLRALPRPAGLFATTDLLAAVCLRLCLENGVGVPDELAILGVGNDELLCEATKPTLSSAALPAEEMGYRAAQILAACLRGQAPPAGPLRIAPGAVIERQSTDVVDVGDPLVRRALCLIRQQATQSIGPADIASRIAASRRTLERRFRVLRGRSLLDEIRLVRLARVAELLTNTALPIKAIAYETGFRSVCHFDRMFRRATGTTPTAFRKKRQTERFRPGSNRPTSRRPRTRGPANRPPPSCP